MLALLCNAWSVCGARVRWRHRGWWNHGSEHWCIYPTRQCIDCHVHRMAYDVASVCSYAFTAYPMAPTRAIVICFRGELTILVIDRPLIDRPLRKKNSHQIARNSFGTATSKIVSKDSWPWIKTCNCRCTVILCLLTPKRDDKCQSSTTRVNSL